MGNSSSGIIEAPLMGKKTLNIGDRQKGRITSNSTITVKNDYYKIMSAIKNIEKLKLRKINQVYLNKNGIKKFSKVINKVNFNSILPKFFYEKR